MISNKNLSCDEIALHMSKVGIPGSVTSQTTVICDKQKKCEIEKRMFDYYDNSRFL